jgi:phenylacetate-coenzyme A ligase PaaK-like adenylate-forming protein
MSHDTSETFAAQRARSQKHFRGLIGPHLERLGWSAERIAAHQTQALRDVLRNALAHSPFHARRLGAVDPETFSLADLRSLPTMTKSEMMASFDDVVTDRRIRRADVERLLAETGDTPRLVAGEYVCLASGGSSGVRGIFTWHWEDFGEYVMSLLRSRIAAAAAAPGASPGPTIGAIIAASSAVHATRATVALVTGDLLDLQTIPATLPLPEIVARLNERKPTMLIGYASILVLLAREQEAGRLAIAPATISGTSEVFALERRAEVARAFGCPVANTLGSSEGLNGVAQHGEAAIEIASDLAIVELVDEANRPVPPGEPSAKVLLTTLYNRAQPLIRYELWDRMVQHAPAREHGHLRVSVEGRTDDVFAYGDLRVHPLAIRSVFVKTPAVSEYQVRQTAGGIDASIVASAPLDSVVLAGRLRDALASAGLREPTVELACVDRIARHPQTGKIARFVPLSASA